MQTFQLLINERFTATTQANTSGLDLQNDYYVYTTKNGGGIVNAFNVRGYLNDSNNQQIITDFFQYLTGSTSQSQALNILSSDEKLATIFNDYYQRVVLSGSNIVNTVLINNNLTGSTQIVANTYYHPWLGFAQSKQLTGITQEIYGSPNAVQPSLLWQEFTTDESYYVPVYIQRSNNQLSRYNYDICDVNIGAKTAYLYPQFSAYTQPLIEARNTYEFNVFIYNLLLAFAFAFAGQPVPPNLVLQLTGTTVNTLVNCFVDVNLKTNENAYWVD